MRFGKIHRLTKKQAIIFIIALSFFVGIILGAAAGGFVEDGGRQKLSAGMDSYFRNFEPNGVGAWDAFREGAFKYGKFVVIIWFLSFVSPSACIISVAVILAARGAGYGFTSALIVKTLAGGTALKAVALYLPQFFINTAACFLMSYLGVNFSLRSSKSNAQPNMREYLAALMAGMCLAILASAADALLYRFYPVENLFAFLYH